MARCCRGGLRKFALVISGFSYKKLIGGIGIILGAGFLNPSCSCGQSVGKFDTIRVWTIVVGNDTLPLVNLNEVDISGKMAARFRARYEEWTKLRYAVYTTYPLALQASGILKDVNSHLANLSDKRQKKAYLAAEEIQLKKEFTPKLENLSIYQGKILMKLISRQTGSNCYDIIKELRGGFSARFWQTIAFFFDGNLKTDYDIQQDKDIELIVREIQTNNSYRSYN